MKNNNIQIEVNDCDYQIHNGQRLVACETAKNDEDWSDRIVKAMELVKLAGGIIKDNRRAA